METIKNNFEVLVEEIEAKNKEAEVGENNTPTFDGKDLNLVFEEIENSLEEYRFESEKKYNDSTMELAQIYLSV